MSQQRKLRPPAQRTKSVADRTDTEMAAATKSPPQLSPSGDPTRLMLCCNLSPEASSTRMRGKSVRTSTFGLRHGTLRRTTRPQMAMSSSRSNIFRCTNSWSQCRQETPGKSATARQVSLGGEVNRRVVAAVGSTLGLAGFNKGSVDTSSQQLVLATSRPTLPSPSASQCGPGMIWVQRWARKFWPTSGVHSAEEAKSKDLESELLGLACECVRQKPSSAPSLCRPRRSLLLTIRGGRRCRNSIKDAWEPPKKACNSSAVSPFEPAPGRALGSAASNAQTSSCAARCGKPRGNS
mmetsp:Transcript_21343/g.45424  ORF Transcript_21343/g.45424 Transcript_21343/m.45424 type:complete len:294 (+) Transcript_21343:199-1080(+)